MAAFLYGIYIQFKIDIRNKEALIFYYLVPLLFYAFVGSFFVSVMEGFEKTLIVSMSVFGITMGGVLGAGMPICNHYGSVLRKAYQVENIPFWAYLIQNYISALLHLMLMSTMILVSAQFLFDATLSVSLGQFYLMIFLYTTICILLSSLLALLFNGTNKMTMAAQCIFLPSILLSGVMMPSSMLNDTFQMVGNVLPATWIMQWESGDSMYGLVLAIGIVVVMFLIAFRLHQIKHKDIV